MTFITFVGAIVLVAFIVYFFKVAFAFNERIARMEREERKRKRDLVVQKIDRDRDQIVGTPKVVKKRKKYKPRQKLCPECGESFKGLIGLNIHRSKKHGYESPYTHPQLSPTPSSKLPEDV